MNRYANEGIQKLTEWNCFDILNLESHNNTLGRVAKLYFNDVLF